MYPKNELQGTISGSYERSHQARASIYGYGSQARNVTSLNPGAGGWKLQIVAVVVVPQSRRNREGDRFIPNLSYADSGPPFATMAF